MKSLLLVSIAVLLLVLTTFSQAPPSKEQMEADKKRFAEAMQKLEEKRKSMSPEARKHYDSMLNSMGVGARMDNAVRQVNNSSSQPARIGQSSTGLIPQKDTKAIAAIAATPSTGNMGAYIGMTNEKAFAAVLPAAKNKAAEIYAALKTKHVSSAQMGNAATALWMEGRTQIALSLMAQACKDDPSNTDNLGNYASMLHMLGASNMAIPILNNLNARFKNNSTILNNLGQAWFALGDMDKADKYLDSTLRLFAGHPQANATKSMIDESKGNKTAALAHAKAAFKQGKSDEKSDRLRQLGYAPGAEDYNSYPPAPKTKDLLNLGGFAMPPFPKSVEECRGLDQLWKSFRADIDKRMKPLQKTTDESNKAMTQRLLEQQKQFMDAKNKTLANPGSVSQSSAMQIAGAPLFAEKMNTREKLTLENLGRRKQAAVRKIAEFIKGEGAALKTKYEDAKKKIAEAMKQAEKNSISQTVDPAAFCPQHVKAANDFLKPYNTSLEGLYGEYLEVEKQLLNEMSYAALYTTYPELLPGVNAGLQMQWLRDLSLTQNGFNFESITKYTCADPGDANGGRLTEFKNPDCNINSEFSQTLGLSNIGFSIKLDCSGMTTKFNALFVGVQLNQDLDHAGFGDSYKSCTVSIGPKVGGKAGVGPIEVSAKAGVGADFEIDRNGIKDVVLTAGAEAEAGIGDPLSASAGMEGRISLNSGAGSIGGTGAFNK